MNTHGHVAVQLSVDRQQQQVVEVLKWTQFECWLTHLHANLSGQLIAGDHAAIVAAEDSEWHRPKHRAKDLLAAGKAIPDIQQRKHAQPRMEKPGIGRIAVRDTPQT